MRITPAKVETPSWLPVPKKMKRLLFRLAFPIAVVVWLVMVFKLSTPESAQVPHSPIRQVVEAERPEFFFLNHSKPYFEWYEGAGTVNDVSYLSQKDIVSSCLGFEAQGHKQSIQDWDKISFNATNVGTLFTGPVASPFFEMYALKVSFDDKDMAPVMVPPRLYGDNLCNSFDQNQGALWKPYCVSTPESPFLEIPPVKGVVRVPHVFCTRSALLNKDGFMTKANFRIIPSSRSRRPADDILPAPVAVVQDPVFVLSQLRGEAIYHFMVESLPRIAPYYDELMANPQIKIHITSKRVPTPFLEFLGFSANRLVTRSVLANNAVIYPEPAISGSRRVYVVRKLREIIFRRLNFYFRNNLREDHHVLVIRRSGPRRISNFDEMMEALKKQFPNDKFEIFRDDPVPSVKDSFRMFYEAKLVIAPHGAGLSNTLACREGTPVIELLMEKKDLNACFVGLSSALGLRHEGFAPPGGTYGGSFTVDLDVMIKLVKPHVNSSL
jgi:hypothetical protein